MGKEPFLLYLVRGPDADWWNKTGAAWLKRRGWDVISAQDPVCWACNDEFPISQIDWKYLLERAHARIERHGKIDHDSVLFKAAGLTLIDDLLLFMSLYSGEYCHWVWRERGDSIGSSTATKIGFSLGQDRRTWAGPRNEALKFFVK
ncbi:MAG: hypothetical protein AAB502_02050, partial [Chloroflexota bacterium]